MRIKLIAIVWFVLPFIFTSPLHAQYAKQLIGDIVAVDITIDNNDNRIITGYLDHPSDNDFDPSEGVTTLTSPQGGTTGYIASYNREGELNFTIQISDEEISPYVGCYFVSTDADDNIYVVGLFAGKADFDPGPGVYELQAANVYTLMCFQASYDKDGNFRYALPLPALSDIETAGAVHFSQPFVVDDAGNSYLLVSPIGFAGYDYDPGPGEFTFPYGKHLISYDKNGNFRFGYQIPSSTRTVGCNGVDAYYIGGHFIGFGNDIDFDPSEGTYILTDEQIDDGVFFLASYNTNGTLNFCK